MELPFGFGLTSACGSPSSVCSPLRSKAEKSSGLLGVTFSVGQEKQRDMEATVCVFGERLLCPRPAEICYRLTWVVNSPRGIGPGRGSLAEAAQALRKVWVITCSAHVLVAASTSGVGTLAVAFCPLSQALALALIVASLLAFLPLES